MNALLPAEFAKLPDPHHVIRELRRSVLEESLAAFVRYFWPVVEPTTPFIEGKAFDAIVEHLEAVTNGEIKRLLMNVPPGSMKSLLTNVFFPAWVWSVDPSLRFVTFSYAANLTERDNRRFASVIRSPQYQELWGDRFVLTKDGEGLIENSATGFKLASSVGGVGTGQRGDFVLLDDPHSVSEAESDKVRGTTTEWFRNTMSNRLNDPDESVIIVIMQRVHQEDVSGVIIDDRLGYTHLMIPAEYEPARSVTNAIGWKDWRTVEGQSFWPERYSNNAIARFKQTMVPFAYAGQYQQNPEPKGGAIIKRDWWSPFYGTTYPTFDYIVGSLDSAYTEKEENDPSALTIWGVYTDAAGIPRAMLVAAWAERLALNDLVEKVALSCSPRPKGWQIDRLLIEAKASGISVSQELRRLYASSDFGVQMINPGRLDKVARVHSISNLFAEGIVQAPFIDDTQGLRPRAFAAKVIDQFALFPRSTHDDLVDSSTQALKHFRDLGLLTVKDERAAQLAEDLRYRGPPAKKLYPV